MTRAAYSLKTLLGQINERFPYRDKASDGGIGDEAHALRVSDHNPDSAGIYHAYDFDHDPDSNGLDCVILNKQLRASGDKRIKYIIFQRKIWYPGVGEKAYTGVNAHEHHLHLSVVSGALGDDDRRWNLPIVGGTTTLVTPIPAFTGTYCKYGDTNQRVTKLQTFMTRSYRGYNSYPVTGFYGDRTRAGIAEFQDRVGITGPDANGETVGPRTLSKLQQYGFRP